MSDQLASSLLCPRHPLSGCSKLHQGCSSLSHCRVCRRFNRCLSSLPLWQVPKQPPLGLVRGSSFCLVRLRGPACVQPLCSVAGLILPQGKPDRGAAAHRGWRAARLCAGWCGPGGAGPAAAVQLAAALPVSLRFHLNELLCMIVCLAM